MFENQPELFTYLLNQPGIDLNLLEMEKFEKNTHDEKRVKEFKQLLKNKRYIKCNEIFLHLHWHFFLGPRNDVDMLKFGPGYPIIITPRLLDYENFPTSLISFRPLSIRNPIVGKLMGRDKEYLIFDCFDFLSF